MFKAPSYLFVFFLDSKNEEYVMIFKFLFPVIINW